MSLEIIDRAELASFAKGYGAMQEALELILAMQGHYSFKSHPGAHRVIEIARRAIALAKQYEDEAKAEKAHCTKQTMLARSAEKSVQLQIERGRFEEEPDEPRG